jgi:hypothetical protein
VLDGALEAARPDSGSGGASALAALSTGQWMRIGFAITWPLALVALIAVIAAVVLFLRH